MINSTNNLPDPDPATASFLNAPPRPRHAQLTRAQLNEQYALDCDRISDMRIARRAQYRMLAERYEQYRAAFDIAPHSSLTSPSFI